MEVITLTPSTSSKQIKPLTYKALCKSLNYQLHQNGLASYLYSIEKYCEEKQLPRLDYLVVKEGTGFPDGILATDSDAIMDFHAQLEEIVSCMKKAEGCFQAEPGDLKFEKKSRAKSSPSIQEEQQTTVTLNKLLEKNIPVSSNKIQLKPITSGNQLATKMVFLGF